MRPHEPRPGGRPAFAPGALRRATAGLLLATMPLAGCYSTRPLETAPVPGTTVLLDVSDQGRVALAERFGPSLERIQGRVDGVTDSTITVRIQSVRYLNGQQSDWTGELASLPRAQFARVRQQQFSRFRTTMLASGLVAAVVTAVLSTNLMGGGSDSQPGEPKPGGSGGT